MTGLVVDIAGRSRDQAGDGIRFAVDEGDALAILGANGSGRTHLLRTVAGVEAVRGGSIRWRGVDVTRAGSARRVQMGIRMAGATATFPRLTVGDNLLAGCHLFAWDRGRVRERVDAMITEFPALAGRLDQVAGSLSGGEQAMLAVASALAGEPALLLLDEPSVGLADGAVQALAGLIGRLRAGGLTALVVERSPDRGRLFADRSITLERGAMGVQSAP